MALDSILTFKRCLRLVLQNSLAYKRYNKVVYDRFFLSFKRYYRIA